MTFNRPFPHTVIDDFIPLATVRAINAEWPSLPLEDGKFTLKRSGAWLPPTAAQVEASIGLGLIESAVGVSGLFADPDRFGGGLHAVPAGGFLKMHVDFNRHPNGWHRRANVLIYLNEDWLPEWGGQLQLGVGKHAVRIEPIAGRCVIFETNEDTWHGHPEPLTCPPDRERRSMAFYYYTEAPPKGEAHTTIYRKAV
jgi:hypothetical protein